MPPTLAYEQRLWDKGHRRVAGLDEAGRGPLAGPVVAAAVVLDPGNTPMGLDDSKRLSHKQRESLFDDILASAEVGIASACAGRIDTMNILAATLWAMRQAILALHEVPDAALVDGRQVPENLPCTAENLVRGDQQSCSIAAASIVAKVVRDRMMGTLARQYPAYQFDAHKGYPTRAHRAIIARLGPTPYHRHTFAPVRACQDR